MVMQNYGLRAFGANEPVINCASSFAELGAHSEAGLRIEKYHHGEYLVNGFWVTGDNAYPLSMVKESLGLSENMLERLPADSKILSVGEGASDLTPSLRKKFPNTKALDIWYSEKGLPAPLQSYVDKNHAHLITGSATNIPLPDQSQNLVLSNYLVTNFKDSAMKHKALDEIVRVLAPGGEARITVFGKKQIPEIYLSELKRKYGDQITYRVENFEIRWRENLQGDELLEVRDGQRLIIERPRAPLGDW